MGLLAAALPAAVRRWGSSARWSPDAETELVPAVFTVPPDRSPSTQKDAAGLMHEVTAGECVAAGVFHLLGQS